MARPAMSTGLTLEVHADLDALAAAQERVRDHLERHGVDARCGAAVDVVLEELGANVVRHGRPPSRLMTLRVEVEPHRVVATLEDDGPAFDPTAATIRPAATSLAEASTGGRGLMLARRMTASLAYTRSGGTNRLTAVFARR
jgi:serine/threonine-protein kinase RsbW